MQKYTQQTLLLLILFVVFGLGHGFSRDIVCTSFIKINNICKNHREREKERENEGREIKEARGPEASMANISCLLLKVRDGSVDGYYQYLPEDWAFSNTSF